MARNRVLQSRVTEKGQVTVPSAIRAKLGIKPRDRVEFELIDGEARIRLARSTVDAMIGIVTPRNRPEDFNTMHDEVERAIAEEVAAEG